MVVAPQLADLQLGRNLPSIPAVAVQVLALVQNPNSTIQDLTEALSKDPALAAKVLQMSNSPLFNRGGGAITSLERAAAILGFRALKVIALGFSLHHEFPSRGERAGMDLAAFWQRSLVNALVARSLARRLGSRLIEEAFLGGLLAELGRLVLALSLAERYKPIVEAAAGWPSLEDERRVLGFDSGDAGVALLRHWQLPPLFGDGLEAALRFDTLPRSPTGETRDLAGMLRLSLLSTQVLFATDELRYPALDLLTAEAGWLYGFQERDVRVLLEHFQRGMGETLALFNLQLPANLSYDSLLEQARVQMSAVSLDAAVSLQMERERAEEFRSRASTDHLTGLANRAAFQEFLTQQMKERTQGPAAKSLGVALMDLDGFKKINDSHGHPTGDAVLRTVAEVLARRTRRNELVARYGGEEFALIAPSVEPAELRMACDRLRAEVAASETPVAGGPSIHVTISIGGLSVRKLRDTAAGDQLVRLADEQLYAAKRAGGNLVELRSFEEI